MSTEMQDRLKERINNSPILNLPPDERCTSPLYMKFVNDIFSFYNDQKKFYTTPNDISGRMEDTYTRKDRNRQDAKILMESIIYCLERYNSSKGRYLKFLKFKYEYECKRGDPDMMSQDKPVPIRNKREYSFTKHLMNYLTKIGDIENFTGKLRQEYADCMKISIEELNKRIQYYRQGAPQQMPEDGSMDDYLDSDSDFTEKIDDIYNWASTLEALIPFVLMPKKASVVLKRKCFYSFMVMISLRNERGTLKALEPKEQEYWCGMEPPYVLTIVKDGHTFQKIAFAPKLLQPLEANKTISEYITEVTGNACNKGRITELKVAFAAEVKRIGELAN